MPTAHLNQAYKRNVTQECSKLVAELSQLSYGTS